MKALGLPAASTPVARTSMRTAQEAIRFYDNQRRLGDLGFLEFLTPLVSMVGGLVGMKSQADAQNKQIKSQERIAIAAGDAAVKQAQITADAYKYSTDVSMKAAEKAAELQFRAAKAKSDADLAAVREQYGSALDALRTQRLAAIDQQASTLISNTSGAIFSLSNQAIGSATKTATVYPKAGVAGLVALGVATFFFLNPPWSKRKRGDKSRTMKIGGAHYESKRSYGG